MLILGIETSCDETAAAVVADGRVVLSSVVATQFELHAQYGGVVPNRGPAASRKPPAGHPGGPGPGRRLLTDIDGLAVTQRPGLVGALIIGMAAAKALSFTLQKPLVGVHHLQGHLMAAFLTETPPAFPFVALVVSGGHTNLYRVDGSTEMALLGRSRDDAAGEAFDKVAKLMALGYPGGVRIEALAATGDASAYQSPPAPGPRGAPHLFVFAASRPRWPTGSSSTRKFSLTTRPGAIWPPAFRRRWWTASRAGPGWPWSRRVAPAWWSAAGWRPTAACARCCRSTPRARELTSFASPGALHRQRRHGGRPGLPPASIGQAPGPFRRCLFPG